MSDHQSFGYDDYGDESEPPEFCIICGEYEEDCECPMTTDEEIERKL